MTPEQRRHLVQLAIVSSGAEIQVGQPDQCPLPLKQLLATAPGQPHVREVFGSGLTAEVYRIEAQGRLWTLKRARERCKVQNIDGKTSFLNEVQRRVDLQKLKADPQWREALAGIVETQYASFRNGVILSPWIAGIPVQDWSERQLLELFDLLGALLENGLFDWDLCPGNILDDGHIRLFDFGYMYRFNPLQSFNSNGRLTPQFHGAERFETRCYYAHLLHLERQQGQAAALAALELEKRIAVEAYQRLRQALAKRGANVEVLDWLDGLVDEWRQALHNGLDGLYLREAWRSHWSDLDDDLRGQTCTPLTLNRIDWLSASLNDHSQDLGRLGVLAQKSADHLREELRQAREQAQCWQV